MKKIIVAFLLSITPSIAIGSLPLNMYPVMGLKALIWFIFIAFIMKKSLFVEV